MGIYIKGMEMPKDRGVYIAIDIDGQAYAKPLGALEWQRLNQKAVPIPAHGRLIDADALFEKIPCGDFEHDTLISRCGAIADVCIWVLSAPTILKAEGE